MAHSESAVFLHTLYNDYSLDGYTRQIVNHSENHVDPNSVVHIQGIERSQLDIKVVISAYEATTRIYKAV